MRSLSLPPDDLLTIPLDGFVDRLHALRFLRACDPSYRALTFTLVGLPPTGKSRLSTAHHNPGTLSLSWSHSWHRLGGARLEAEFVALLLESFDEHETYLYKSLPARS